MQWDDLLENWPTGTSQQATLACLLSLRDVDRWIKAFLERKHSVFTKAVTFCERLIQ